MPEYELYHSETESTYTFIVKGNPVSLESDAVKIWETKAKSWEIACLRKHSFLGWEPYKPMIVDTEDLFAFLPEDKFDLENLQLLMNLGYPKIEPVLEELFAWIQDYNWPVAKKLAPFLSDLGGVCQPYIQKIFHSGDSMWIYWTLTTVILSMKVDQRKIYEKDLIQLKATLSDQDRIDGLEEAIDEILQKD